MWLERQVLGAESSVGKHCWQGKLGLFLCKKAVSILMNDPFPHTTLGKVCVKIGIDRKDSVGVERFWEGVNELKISRDLSTQNGLEWEHPYITFFTYALRAAKSPHFNGETERLSLHWKIWMKAAQNSGSLVFDDQGRSLLNGYQRQWILNAVAD